MTIANNISTFFTNIPKDIKFLKGDIHTRGFKTALWKGADLKTNRLAISILALFFFTVGATGIATAPFAFSAAASFGVATLVATIALRTLSVCMSLGASLYLADFLGKTR